METRSLDDDLSTGTRRRRPPTSVDSYGSSAYHLPTLLVHVLFAVVLCAFHIQATDASSNFTSANDENGPDFLTRFTSGGLTKMDMVLLVSLGVLAMEIVNWVSLNAGGA